MQLFNRQTGLKATVFQINADKENGDKPQEIKKFTFNVN